MPKRTPPRIPRSARRYAGGRVVPTHCGRPMLRLSESEPWAWQCQICSYRRTKSTVTPPEGPKAA